MLTPIIQDQTTHLLKMKWDAKYRAEFEALQSDLAQAEKALAKAPDKTTDKTPVVETKAPSKPEASVAAETELDRKYRALLAADEIVAKTKAKQTLLQKTVFQTNPTLQR